MTLPLTAAKEYMARGSSHQSSRRKARKARRAASVARRKNRPHRKHKNKNRNAPVISSPPVSAPLPPVENVYTVASQRHFMDDVAEGLIRRYGDDPLQLSDVTVLVPDDDALRSLRRAFVEKRGGKMSMLPRIQVSSDVEEDQLALELTQDRVLSEALAHIPPAVTRLHRQIILAKEVMKTGMASSPQKALQLGAELGNMLDQMQRHNIDLKKIDSVVPDAFRAQWAPTAQFLKILTDTWPAYLETIGRIDPEERKNVVLNIQAIHWQQHPPKTPFVAVGFTGIMPQTHTLLAAVANMPKGSIVIPGVDQDLDARGWSGLTETHPQFFIREVLKTLKATPAMIRPWVEFDTPPDLARKHAARHSLWRETMHPTASGANMTGASVPAEALSGLNLIVGATPQDEASVIALKMREGLEAQGHMTALITEDRSLARRVTARLRHWGIDISDSAGMSLAETGVGIYLSALAEMAAQKFAPVPTLEVLKHPLSTLGETKEEFRQKSHSLEDKIFHGARPAAGMKGLKDSLAAYFNRAAARPDLTTSAFEHLEDEKHELNKWLDHMMYSGRAFLEHMGSGKPVPFIDLLDDHIRFAEAMAQTPQESGAARLWSEEDGVRAARFLRELREDAALIPPVTGENYVNILTSLMHGIKVRPNNANHPQLRILTPVQGRFFKADTYILGGLNDEVWPARVEANPWMSPDMIRALGLPRPETTIGRSAHILVDLASKDNVILMRSERSGSAPAVESPFISRLLLTLKAAGLTDVLAKKSLLLDIHTAMQTPSSVIPVAAPHPTPPKELRPKMLPVSGIETLMRDPYSVYAKYILKLKPRAPIDAGPTVAEKGTFIHDALDMFVKKYPDTMPENALDELTGIGREVFATRLANPLVQFFWWPRFERIAAWFVKFERERRDVARTLGTEVNGRLKIDLGGGEEFVLTAIADRVDRDVDGKIDVIDYKTGAIPTQTDVDLGFSPQLTLEAAIVYAGGMKGIPASDVGSLQYWKLSGGRPAAEITAVAGNAEQLAEEALQGVTSLMQAFNDVATPYHPEPRPSEAPRYNNYRHLSRADEWSKVKPVLPKPKKPRVKKEEKPENANPENAQANDNATPAPATKKKAGEKKGRRHGPK